MRGKEDFQLDKVLVDVENYEDVPEFEDPESLIQYIKVHEGMEESIESPNDDDESEPVVRKSLNLF